MYCYTIHTIIYIYIWPNGGLGKRKKTQPSAHLWFYQQWLDFVQELVSILGTTLLGNEQHTISYPSSANVNYVPRPRTAPKSAQRWDLFSPVSPLRLHADDSCLCCPLRTYLNINEPIPICCPCIIIAFTLLVQLTVVIFGRDVLENIEPAHFYCPLFPAAKTHQKAVPNGSASVTWKYDWRLKSNPRSKLVRKLAAIAPHSSTILVLPL